MRPTLPLFILIAALTHATRSQAQPPPGPPPKTLTIRPAAEPIPALKYRLLPERLSLVPGNAAVFYHRALLMANQVRTNAASVDKEAPGKGSILIDEKFSDWIGGPIAAIPVEEARKALESFRNPLKEVELGARRSTCDWEFDRRDEGYSLLLPDIQEIRTLARMFALKARLAILDGKTDEAMHWIEVGFTLGHHATLSSFIIPALVGVSIDNLMAHCLEEWVQVPGTPSLYWTLADRPRPTIDLRYAMEGERSLLEKELPALKELDRGIWGLDQARKFSDEVHQTLFSLLGGEAGYWESSVIPPGTTESTRQLAFAAMTAKVYPEARRALIAEGRPEAEVEAMPIVQVSTLFAYRQYRRELDEIYKRMNLPPWQPAGRYDPANKLTVEQKRANPLFALFYSLIPFLDGAKAAALLLDRNLDALQCVEAIRLYASSHDGKFPASLDALQETPAPIDLATGKPFEYKVDGDSATLSGPVLPGGPNHPSYAIRYVLKSAR